MNNHRARTDDPFLLGYDSSELQTASEFLANWLPFLSRDLCHHCTQTISDRIQSLGPEVDGDVKPLNQVENSIVSTLNKNLIEYNENHDDCDTNSMGSWKDGADSNDTAESKSLTSLKDGTNEASISRTACSPVPVDTPKVRMSWADMAQEDEFEEENEEYEVYSKPVDVQATSEEASEFEEENEVYRKPINVHATSEEASMAEKEQPKSVLSRERREYIRFSMVKREKDFICLERVKGKFVNILSGLELHTHVFSAAEQNRIVDFVYVLREMGKKGKLKERTYTEPLKWMRGKGRVTIQFGCCYNYATDKNGNPPGILQNEIVDPIPHLFKVIIRRLVKWHVLPPSCVPDSCIVNIYEEGDCIPPHIDNHDFLRPFCTVSFLSECNIVFGTNLLVLGPGEFTGSIAIPLPVGSVLVLNGNGADVAKHCVPAVPTKRISITFRKMDESKLPVGFVPEPDLQGLQPLSYEDKSKRQNPLKSKHLVNQAGRRENNRGERRGSAERGNTHLEPHYSFQIQRGAGNRRRARVNLDS